MRIDFISIFPEVIRAYFQESMMKKAQEAGLVDLFFHDLREYSLDKHKKVDDTPYGGGAGMVMSCEPWDRALEAVRAWNQGKIVHLSPRGRLWDQRGAEAYAGAQEDLIFLCGRYEGIDQRIIDLWVDEEICVGPYILTGGELAAMSLADSIIRLIPGVLGHEESAPMDSFSQGLNRAIEHPHYTKPAVYKGLAVPEVLLSGNHQAIGTWRHKHCQNSSFFDSSAS